MLEIQESVLKFWRAVDRAVLCSTYICSWVMDVAVPYFLTTEPENRATTVTRIPTPRFSYCDAFIPTSVPGACSTAFTLSRRLLWNLDVCFRLLSTSVGLYQL